MSRRRKAAAAILSAIALGAVCATAQAQPKEQASDEASKAPPYTLEVDSDAPDVVSYEALAARIGSDLGAPVVRPGDVPAARAALTIHYRARVLTIRAVHPGGRALERTVKAEGNDAAVQSEAVLLAGNLARDEARELLDSLAARPAPSPGAKPAAAKANDDGTALVTVALFYPLATNLGRPNVKSNFDFSLLYGRVGTVAGLSLGSAVVHASRGVDGAQLAAAAALTGGSLDGAQISGALNVATGSVDGGQLAGAANIAGEGMSGVQLAGAFNLARGSGGGLAIAGGANVSTHEFDGAQIASVNVAENVSGAQIGAINIGRRVKGLQLGAINIAEEVDGVAIGAISISKNSLHPIAWASNLQYMNAGIKFTTKHVYTLLAVHYGTLEADFDNVGMTAALGGRVPLPARFDVEIQGSVTHLYPRPSQSTKNGNLWVAPQVIGGYSFAPHLRVFAGGGVRIPAFVDLGREVVRPEALAGVEF